MTPLLSDVIASLGEKFTQSLKDEADKLQKKADRVVNLVYVMTVANLTTMFLAIWLVIR